MHEPSERSERAVPWQRPAKCQNRQTTEVPIWRRVSADGGGWEPLGQPYFDNSTKREATAAVGQPAYLHCRVRNLADRAVSWIRKRDLHILTVGVHTYSSDARFAALHADGSDEWTLRVAPAQPRDSGAYECQVSTEPKISLSFRLTVVESCLSTSQQEWTYIVVYLTYILYAYIGLQLLLLTRAEAPTSEW
ncbi:hypothetical protein MSG28_012342 [Choristoneura fumiferana]|uniref:Uncharacterized protein n=1 Tax=Choristoneura fumiferana TaxID=7141 RepID=A0ACC0KD66_CHOFU|nr:hypothetical protein MSG28_012342 [Choristoneura fumiferana]